ncbi:MAG: hypothetical protein E4H01_02560, partial [Lysobacterales bacterium]
MQQANAAYRQRITRMLALAGVLAASPAGNAGAAPPQRIVSINICGDLLALTLAPRARIASV